jgi:hypothetical protein
MIGSIPCPIILNNIILGEIGTHKKNNASVLAQVSTQHPFTCATNVLGERKHNLVCHIWTLLAPHHPCMANFIRVIYPMGDMGTKDPTFDFTSTTTNHDLLEGPT